MKTFFLIFLLFPLVSKSQNCDSLMTKDVDKFTDKVSYFTRPDIIRMRGKNVELLMNLSKSESGRNYLSFIVNQSGFGCTDEDNVIYFLFTDGTKANFKNSSSFSCQGSSFIALDKNHRENKPLIDLLQNKKISAIKINSRLSSYEVQLDNEESEIFMQGCKCIFSLK